MTADEAAPVAVRQLHEAWLVAEQRGDIEGILALCTSDVRWLAPGSGMLVGLEAGRRLLTDTQVELQNIVASDLHVEISGDLAYKTSRYTRPAIGYRVRGSCTSREVTISGSFGERERNGAWRW